MILRGGSSWCRPRPRAFNIGRIHRLQAAIDRPPTLLRHTSLMQSTPIPAVGGIATRRRVIAWGNFDKATLAAVPSKNEQRTCWATELLPISKSRPQSSNPTTSYRPGIRSNESNPTLPRSSFQVPIRRSPRSRILSAATVTIPRASERRASNSLCLRNGSA